MDQHTLSVRELQERDIDLIVNYWLESDPDHLLGMGVDLKKLPTRAGLSEMLLAQVNQTVEKKQSYCMIWEVDQQAIGHCNVNKIIFGEEAYMHLHLWHKHTRKKGIGHNLVKMTVPFFFKSLQLKKLYCEPYALNPAPNKTLEKTGFTFLKKHTTIPGTLNFEQEVNLWVLTAENVH
ncbi:MAG: hypothetical protein DHS20C18_07000 [Saprospiraceae bacterium]|nr:MAG: hypothetical protein DHS20C18_07000 [Saprospiraceae bacterium]